MTPVYKRVMLKVSGEALSGGTGNGIDAVTINQCADAIKKLHDMGCEVGIACGGGNFWRGARNGLVMERSRADHMGMLATIMNCIALSETLENHGVKTRVLSNVSVPLMCENYNVVNATRYLSEGYVVLFAGGTGSPYFTTDTGVVLKGIEMHVDLILMAKNVDGIYTSDPNKDPAAKRYTEITYQEVLTRNLRATDPTAMSLLMDNQIPMLVFKLDDPETIVKGVLGEAVGTVVKSEF